MGIHRIKLFFSIVAIALVLPAPHVSADDFSNIPVKDMVTMVDLGAKKCVPCKMMAPIMVKLEKAYEGKAAVVFIDVWENRNQAKRFNIRSIPTQIFFDASGKEVFRHVGFFDEQSIVEQMSKMGVKQPAPAPKG